MTTEEFNLSKIHNCEKCQGKIVVISIDDFGVTRCNYCNEIVNYSSYFKYFEAKNNQEEKERILKLIEGLIPFAELSPERWKELIDEIKQKLK